MGGLFGHHNTNTVTRADVLTELQLNQATYGATVPIIIGTTRVSGNIIDYCDFTANEHKETQTQRVGKGGGSRMTSTNITYTYSVAVAIGLCEGPITGVRKTWRNKDELGPPTSAGLELFNGSYNQRPWSYMTGSHADRALPYGGLAYVAGVVDLGSSSSLPQFSFEVQGLLLDRGDGTDVNPADYILYLLTDDTNGVGFTLNDIDLQSLDRARKYWAAADLLISSPKSGKSKSARDVINDICALTGVYVFWSQNRLRFVPICRDSLYHDLHLYEPNNQVIYDLTKDDFIPQNGGACVTFERKDSSQAFNVANVEFTNRANGYENETVTFEVTSDVLRHGVRPGPKISADYVYTKERATFIAELVAKDYVYRRNTYHFTLDWAYSALEPGDLVTITDEPSGLDHKVVIITDIKEGIDGTIDVIATSVPDGTYSAALYTVYNGERGTIDRTVKAPTVDHVSLFQPSGEITKDGLELWCAVNATGDHWGGCKAFVSDDNQKYNYVGDIPRQGTVGELVDGINNRDTEMTVKLYHGELLSVNEQDAQRGNTLCWLDGELLSYTTATLIGPLTYKLSGVIRGQYNTTSSAQGKGTRFVRLEQENIFKKSFREEDIGKDIWLKFASYNEFGMGEDELDSVEAHKYTLKSYYIPQVSKLSARLRYRTNGVKISNYDIVVTVTPPNMNGYDKTAIFYKTSDKWEFAGFTGTLENETTLVIPQASVGEHYTIKAIVYDKHGFTSDDSTALTTTVDIVAKSETPQAPEGITLQYSTVPILTWQEVTNSDVDYYEVRSNDTPGNSNGLLSKVNNTSASLSLTSRQGKLYVFAHNPNGTYSMPGTLTYNKPAPPPPKNVKVKSIIDGLSITCDPLPPGASKIVVYVDDNRYETISNMFTYHGEAGNKQVRVAYADALGEGAKSDSIMGTVKHTIPQSYLDGLKVSTDMLDKAITQAIDTAKANASQAIDKANKADKEASSASKQASDAISKATDATNKANTANSQANSAISKANEAAKQANYSVSQVNTANGQVKAIIDNLNKDPNKSGYSAIAQLANGLSLRVKKGDLVSEINQAPSGVTIDGRLIRITGDTVFDKSVNVKKLLQADSLSAINANLGNVQGGSITSTNIRASNIDVGSIKKAGYELMAINTIEVETWHGLPIVLPRGMRIDRCLWFELVEHTWWRWQYLRRDGWNMTSPTYNDWHMMQGEPIDGAYNEKTDDSHTYTQQKMPASINRRAPKKNENEYNPVITSHTGAAIRGGKFSEYMYITRDGYLSAWRKIKSDSYYNAYVARCKIRIMGFVMA